MFDSENISRVMYINQNGELFLQFRPDDKSSKAKASIEALKSAGVIEDIPEEDDD